jgi:signal peptidase I
MDKRTLTSILVIVITVFSIVISAVIVLKVFFIVNRVVVSDSMAPTLIEGDQLICWRLAIPAKIDRPDRAIGAVLKVKDIVVFKLTEGTDYLIKRIIGLPGDTVEMKTDGVFVNGEKLFEEYLPSEWDNAEYRKYEIPDDCVFVLGDHRALSRDSREFGVVRADEIKEKVLFRFYPPGRIGTIR